MSDIAIAVENLSKSYLIGHQASQREPYRALRDVIAREARNFARKGLDFVRGRQIVQGDDVEQFWALRDVSFEVKRGEVLGIIGRNGAGKSTLLKILSRITEPDGGRAVVRGRVASLLEVGTGFHAELSGRENIFLNGTILGMARREISRKFDEIVSFAEIDKFLDTPVKRYSSGMYVRLAFAVAAHLESEILIVDEVLAVGDADFQKKCLGKIRSIGTSGRTVLYVSHNLASIETLCNRCVVMRAGRVAGQGTPSEMVRLYLQAGVTDQHQNKIELYSDRNLDCYVESIEMLDLDGRPKNQVFTWDDVRMRVTFFSVHEVKKGSVVLKLSTLDGRSICLLATQPDQTFNVSFEKGRNAVDCIIRSLPLSAGDFLIGAGLAVPNVEWLAQSFDEKTITIHPKDIYGAGTAPIAERGLIAARYQWELVSIPTGQ
jgi:lipopolysaccharide transport system ATP-binding protein